jgi:phosphoglucosamine mutase
VRDHLLTGDGLYAALKVLEYSIKSEKTIHLLRQIFESCPSVNRKISVNDKSIVNHPSVKTAIGNLIKDLPKDMRLIVRPSGTEQIIRISAEGTDLHFLEEIVDRLSYVIKSVQENTK